MSANAVREQQQNLCRIYGADFLESPHELKIGIADNVRPNVVPIHGLRHPPEGTTCGWYIYAGETLSPAEDFFKPMHVDHLSVRCPEVIQFLGLAPGWRFLLAGEHRDVWYDPELLDI